MGSVEMVVRAAEAEADTRGLEHVEDLMVVVVVVASLALELVMAISGSAVAVAEDAKGTARWPRRSKAAGEAGALTIMPTAGPRARGEVTVVLRSNRDSTQ